VYATAEDVTEAVVRVACAGDRSAASRASTAKAVRALMDNGYRLVREDEQRRARRSLAQAWSAWLDLMLSVSLPSAGGRSLLQEALDFEPGLRQRFEEFLGGRRG
jgi:hypothetical protein